jgi:hypothetical protein
MLVSNLEGFEGKPNFYPLEHIPGYFCILKKKNSLF